MCIGHQNIGTLNLYQCKPDGNTKYFIINSKFVRAIHEVGSSSSMDFMNIQKKCATFFHLGFQINKKKITLYRTINLDFSRTV